MTEPSYGPEADAAFEAYVEEQEAIEEGRAVRLLHCYTCYLAEHRTPDFSERGDLGPLRGVVSTFVTPGFDPYQGYRLTCGHSII